MPQMIYTLVTPGARLGNVLFQVAAGISLAHRLGTEFGCVAGGAKYTYVQSFAGSFLHGVYILDSLPPGVPVYCEPRFAYDPLPTGDNGSAAGPAPDPSAHPLTSPTAGNGPARPAAGTYLQEGTPCGSSDMPAAGRWSGNGTPRHPNPDPDLAISGYFQSYRYFDERLVRSQFSPSEEVKAVLSARYPVLAGGNVCAVSVRRGDYLRLPAMHPVCGIRYYRRAMDLMPAGTVFMVFSDDPQWCRRHFRGGGYIFADNQDAVTQLYLMSMCRHHIISNSSFGWWGAWLAEAVDRKVIYPSNWFGPFYKNHDTRSLFPGSWRPLRNPLSLSTRLGILLAYIRKYGVGTAKKIKGWKIFKRRDNE